MLFRSRPPRNPDHPLLTRELIGRICLVGFLLLLFAFGLFEWTLAQGRSVEAARTCAVNAFVFSELFYLFNCRSLRYSAFYLGFAGNRLLLIGVALMIALQLLFTYHPVMQIAFGSQAIGMGEWALILAGSAIIYGAVETEKAIRRGRSAVSGPAA